MHYYSIITVYYFNELGSSSSSSCPNFMHSSMLCFLFLAYSILSKQEAEFVGKQIQLMR